MSEGDGQEADRAKAREAADRTAHLLGLHRRDGQDRSLPTAGVEAARPSGTAAAPKSPFSSRAFGLALGGGVLLCAVALYFGLCALFDRPAAPETEPHVAETPNPSSSAPAVQRPPEPPSDEENKKFVRDVIAKANDDRDKRVRGANIGTRQWTDVGVAYERNEIAADKRFKDHVVELNGPVYKVGRADDVPEDATCLATGYLEFSTSALSTTRGLGEWTIRCYFRDASVLASASGFVTVRGICLGRQRKPYGDIVFVNCALK